MHLSWLLAALALGACSDHGDERVDAAPPEDVHDVAPAAEVADTSTGADGEVDSEPLGEARCAELGHRLDLGAVPPDPYGRFDDLRVLLERATGAPWSDVASPPCAEADGVRLRLAREALDDNDPAVAAMAARVDGASAWRTAHAWVTGAHGVTLLGNTTDGLVYAGHAWLDALGVRYLGATEAWTVVPTLHELRSAAGRAFEAVYPTLSYFPNQGFGGWRGATDRSNAWFRMKDRMRLPVEIELPGQAGETLNVFLACQLREDPAFFLDAPTPLPPCARAPTGSCLDCAGACQCPPGCITGAEAECAWLGPVPDPPLGPAHLDPMAPGLDAVLARFVDESAHRAAAAEGVAPSDGSVLVSLEAEDGWAPACPSLLRDLELSEADATPADCVADLARRVLALVTAEHARVGFMSYSAHGAVPTVPLDPGAVVVVAQDYLDGTGLTRLERNRAWQDKQAREGFLLGAYSYVAITEAVLDVPGHYQASLPELAARLGPAGDYGGYRLFMAESSLSQGLLGPIWFWWSRLAWSDDARGAGLAAVLDDYFATAFGAAAPPLRRLYERWWRTVPFDRLELGLAVADVSEALASPGLRDDERRRVIEIAAYVEYARLLRALLAAPAGEARDAVTAELVPWLVRLEPTTMVNAQAIFHALAVGHVLSPGAIARWYDPAADCDALGADPEVCPILCPTDARCRYPELTDAEVAARIASAAATWPPIPLSDVPASETLAPLTVPAAGVPYTTEIIDDSLGGGDARLFALYAARDRRVAIGFECQTAGHTPVVVATEDGRVVLDGAVVAAGASELAFDAPETTTYRMRIDYDPAMARCLLRLPRDLPFVRVGNGAAGVSDVISADNAFYFYVPGGVTRFAFTSDFPARFSVDGVEVATVRDGALSIVEVDPARSGRVWRVFGLQGHHRFVNLPSLYAYWPDTVMIPSSWSALVPHR